MDFFVKLLFWCAVISFVLFLIEHFFHLCKHVYDFVMYLFDWNVAILFLRTLWLILTIAIISLVDYLSIIPAETIEEYNQNIVLFCLIVYSTSLLLAFVADLKYWKKPVSKLELTVAGEDKHKALVLNTATSLGTTVLFAYLLMIQGSVQQIMIDYSPTNGSLNSWQLAMGVAWLACSFASVKLVLNHAIEIRKNDIEKAKNDKEKEDSLKKKMSSK